MCCHALGLCLIRSLKWGTVCLCTLTGSSLNFDFKKAILHLKTAIVRIFFRLTVCSWTFGCGYIFEMCKTVKSFRSTIGETWFFRFSRSPPFEFFLCFIGNSSIINSKGPLKIWKIKFLQSIWNFSQLHTLQKYDRSQKMSYIAQKTVEISWRRHGDLFGKGPFMNNLKHFWT